jgi:hypothetical protein
LGGLHQDLEDDILSWGPTCHVTQSDL